MSDSESDESVFEFDFDTDISDFSGFSAKESSDSEVEGGDETLEADPVWQEQFTPPMVCFDYYLSVVCIYTNFKIRDCSAFNISFKHMQFSNNVSKEKLVTLLLCVNHSVRKQSLTNLISQTQRLGIGLFDKTEYSVCFVVMGDERNKNCLPSLNLGNLEINSDLNYD